MSTQRSKATLDALFPDNTARLITPAMLRDFVESCVPSYGAMHFNDPGTLTPIAASLTWTKAANASALDDGAYRFSQAANNRLQYDGVADARSMITATVSLTAAANNKYLAVTLGVNGTPLTASKMSTKIGTGGDVQSVTVVAHPTLTPSDYVELFIMNETDDVDITVAHAEIIAFAFLS